MYLVIEMQKNGNTMAHIETQKADRDAAEQTYHTILAAAAVSSVEVHTAVILNEEGAVIKRETYKHAAANSVEG